MNMEWIDTKNAPKAIGPYAQALRVGNLLYTSGQIALDPESGTLVSGGIRAECERVMKNLSALLIAGGSSPERVIKTTCFLVNMEDFAVFNEIYAEFFTNKPARSCVAVAALPKGARVEVEVVALTD